MAAGATAAGVSDLLAYYNTIEGVARAGGSRADAWQEIQEVQAEYSLAAPNSTIFDMNEVWQRANAVIQAEQGYARDLSAGALTGDAWAWAPWATQTTAAWQQSNFQVRYNYEVVGPSGDVQTFWGQTDWQGFQSGMPSLDDIQSRVQTSAELGFAGNSFRNQGGGQLGTDVALGNIVAVQLLRV